MQLTSEIRDYLRSNYVFQKSSYTHAVILPYEDDHLAWPYEWDCYTVRSYAAAQNRTDKLRDLGITDTLIVSLGAL